jgi:hypothetical protein
MRLTTPLAFLFLVLAGINAEPMFPGNNLDLNLQSKKLSYSFVMKEFTHWEIVSCLNDECSTRLG